MTSLGRITHHEEDKDEWICICGNTPGWDGFLPCDEHGKYIEPDSDVWKNLYLCCYCGRIIHQDTLEVIGMAEQ